MLLVANNVHGAQVAGLEILDRGQFKEISGVFEIRWDLIYYVLNVEVNEFINGLS